MDFGQRTTRRIARNMQVMTNISRHGSSSCAVGYLLIILVFATLALSLSLVGDSGREKNPMTPQRLSPQGTLVQYEPRNNVNSLFLIALAVFQTLLTVDLLRPCMRRQEIADSFNEREKRANGMSDEFAGSADDTPNEKLAHDPLTSAGGRLIECQERERSRIARELHDDICQRLTLLSLEIEQARNALDESHVDRDARILGIRQRCCEIASDVQALSHELHSSKLDHLGLEAALRGFCKEFSKQQNLEVSLTQNGVPSTLPKDISLCLFRVTQEALRNAAKHSGATRLTVDLLGAEDLVLLEIRDSGVGFDMQRVAQANGLGLVSMQERVHLVEGVFTIESTPNQGTRIWVMIPLTGQLIPTEPTVSARVASGLDGRGRGK
jgi:signal transduction histidine kinase